MSIDLRAKLTPHFAMWEFVVSDTAARRGIGNVPTPEHWARLTALSNSILEPARETLGPIRITSGYRSPALNTAVGGAGMSQHCFGEAVDIIPLKVSLKEAMVWIVKHTPFDQCILEFNEWIHVSHKYQGAQRGEVLIADKVDGKTRYLIVPIEALT